MKIVLSSLFRQIASALLLIATGLAGFWFGEGFRPLISTPVLLAFVVLPLATAGLAPHRDSFHVRITLLAAALLFIGTWSAGQTMAERAFQDCLERAEEVRTALRSYRLQHGHFPAELADLAMDLPGRRLSRPPLLSYQLQGPDYRLSFANTSVRHLANARYPFILSEP